MMMGCWCLTWSNHGRLGRWRKWKSRDVGETKEGLKNELWRRWSNGRVGEWAVSSAHSPSLVTSPTSQLIFQSLPRFTYVTAHSSTITLLHLRHSSFFNPSFASPTSRDFHLRHLASRPWVQLWNFFTARNACRIAIFMKQDTNGPAYK